MVSPSLCPTFPHISCDIPNYYTTDSLPHGRCIVVNNSHFTRIPGIVGSEKNVANITNTFSKLGYIVEVLTDLPYRKYINCIGM